VTRTAHQVHGAIGFTLEHDLRLATTRLWAWCEEDCSDSYWLTEIGRRTLAVGADGLWPMLTSSTGSERNQPPGPGGFGRSCMTGGQRSVTLRASRWMIGRGLALRLIQRVMSRGLSAIALLGMGAGVLVLAPGTSSAAERSESSGPYVAMGDSYVAGPVIPVQSGRPLGCLRSSNNYPSLVRRVLHSSGFTDVSCSGATTDNITGPQSVTGGTNPPQVDALSGDTKLVTIGIGGNDIGFAGIIETCAARSITTPLGSGCKDYYTSGGRDQLAERIDQAGSKIAAVLEEINQRAPHARVLVVGYPTILPDSGPGCFPLVPVTPGDVAYLRRTEQKLNAMLAEQADEAGARYVDTYHSSIGHDVCKLPGTKWVEGLVPTAPAAPFHPNLLGMHNSASRVLAALRSNVATD
jgi:lysophospholipase L1-like esterase